MKRITREQLLELHRIQIERYGGSDGILNSGAIDSALAQPFQGFGGVEFYPSIEEKTAMLGFSLISNHAFCDGNKRIGYSAMDTFLRLNGFKLKANTDDAEAITMGVASHQVTREQLAEWIQNHLVKLD
jgi:death-on-curing protein